jgi:hypothetical protein
MTSVPSRSGSKQKRPRGRLQRGTAGSGKAFDPTRAPPGAECDEPRPAPAPGVPVSEKQYEALKKKAKTARTARSRHAQKDPSG